MDCDGDEEVSALCSGLGGEWYMLLAELLGSCNGGMTGVVVRPSDCANPGNLVGLTLRSECGRLDMFLRSSLVEVR